MKKILVTGGSGFLGSHLCERLLNEGNEVICIDNLLTASKDNIKPFLDNKNFHFIMHDITIPFTIYSDEIYNLACPASPIHYQKNAIHTIKTNVLGAINVLELAKLSRASVLQASTSEIYGDPLEHPQTESYWGNVNTFGDRSCYDEGKRVVETLFYDYCKAYNIDIRIARIFNSLTGDQKVIYYKDGILKYNTFEECYNDIKDNIENVLVPCFNKEDKKYRLMNISGIHKHKVTKKGFEITTTWGRKVKLTEDHGLFIYSKNEIKEVFVKDLKVGDKIAIPNRLTSMDIPLLPFKISEVTKINDLRKYDTFISINGSNKKIKDNIDNINDFLWFLGFFTSEGSLVFNPKNGDYIVSFFSDIYYLEKLKIVVSDLFSIDVEIKKDSNGSYFISIQNKLIFDLIVNVFEFGISYHKDRDIPEWIMQLPEEQLSIFLKGLWQGDGNHNSKTSDSEFIINSSSKQIIEKVCFMLLKFGIISSIQEFYTYSKKGEEKKFKSYRVRAGGLKNFISGSIFGSTQFCQRLVTEDITWAHIIKIDEFNIEDEYVYDFSVPECENFVGGNFIACHNTYGPKMCEDDGRVVSNFIVQALNNEDITIYGDGSQTRSFGYVSDTVDGLIRLMNSGYRQPVNIGNPNEFTVRELAEKVIKITRSKSKIIYMSLPSDDPKQRKPDISRAINVLKWEPRIDLDSGLVKTIEYFKERIL